jgi:hypothetical protein
MTEEGFTTPPTDVESCCCCFSSKVPVWPQVLLFPEGTCTNGKALIKFKSGAFQVSSKEIKKYVYLCFEQMSIFI